MDKNNKINYIEFPSNDLKKTIHFYERVFGWEFTFYGDDYIAFEHAGIDGGFYAAPSHSSTENGSALVVFYTDDIDALQAKIEACGGKIVKPIFAFPGGRRFHFTDLTGNELAVWSEPA